MDEAKAKKKFKLKVPHVYSLLLMLILICAILTYIIPAGTYDMMTMEDGRNVVDPTTFHYIDKTPVGLMSFLTSIFQGMLNAAEIIFLIFICGGAFGVIMKTGAFDAALVRLALIMNGKERAIIPVMMLVFAFMGCTMGSAEDLIVYIPIMVSMCLAMKFDSLTAVAIVLVGAGAGFTGSIMNPYTEGVAQSIAGLPVFSGLEFRAAILVVMTIIAIVYVMRYAGKIKKDPTKSPMYEIDLERDTNLELNLEEHPFGLGKKLVVLAFFVAIGLLVFGTLKLGWYFAEICGLFLGLGIVAGICDRMSLDEFGNAFAAGMGDMAVGALVVGFARGILVVLEAGNIIHTMLYGASIVLGGLPGVVSAEGMYVFQCLTNFIIPSGSGQAAVTMPLMAPLADIVGVTRQTACIAFQMGDGISNIFTPTSGYLMASLAMAKIPWEKWAKFILPLIGIWYATGAVFVAIAHIIQLGPF